MTDDSVNPSEFIKKKVDESWKESVQKERFETGADEPPKQEQSLSFSVFISTLAMQAIAALGLDQDSEENGAEPNLDQAKYIIDTLQILAEKTRGNLTPQEETELKTVLYQLHLKFVEQKKLAGL